MGNIYLVRHGKVDGDAALYGRTDVAVSDKENNRVLKQLISLNIKPEQVISSPLSRCLSLAQLYSAASGASVLRYAAFKEMAFGDIDGIPFDDLYQVPQQWQTLEKFWADPVQHSLPNAELLAGFSYRVIHGWNNLLKQHKDTNSQSTVVICHGGVIRMILAHILGVDWRNAAWYTSLKIANGSVTTLSFENDQVSVNSIAVSPCMVEVA